MADETPDPFIIEEMVSGGLTLTLDDFDLPFGRAREIDAFTSGGKVDIAEDGIYNPGSKLPVVQLMQLNKNKPMVLKGHFRDHLWGVDGHARAQQVLTEKIRKNGNAVRITWGAQVREGVLWETSFGEQDEHNFSYELTFLVVVDPHEDSQRTTDQPTQETPSLEDITADMLERVQQMNADATAQVIEAENQFILAAAFSTLTNSLNDLSTVTNVIERSVFPTPQDAAAQAKRVDSSAQSAQTAVVSALAVLDPMTPALGASSSERTSWSSYQLNASVALDDITDDLRTVRAQARKIVNDATQLYQVKQGDTAESIAQSELRARGRSHQLGISDAQLKDKVGSYIRIPKG